MVMIAREETIQCEKCDADTLSGGLRFSILNLPDPNRFADHDRETKSKFAPVRFNRRHHDLRLRLWRKPSEPYKHHS